ncbi:MAG: glycosyltransferase family 2 protein [Candidatus Nanosyncoccaceae bacterium]
MKKLISLVLPCYNEAGNLPILYKEILKFLDTKKYKFEIIFINDGSKDQTWGVIQKIALANRDKAITIRGIDFSANFGHAAALEAGTLACRGDAMIAMDADMQKPPRLIKKFIKEWEAGYEIVNTEHDLGPNDWSFVKKVTSKMFYGFMNLISDVKFAGSQADFRLIDRKVIDEINKMPESPKFYRGLVKVVGFKTKTIFYEERERLHGKTGYSLIKQLRLAKLGVLSFSAKPLYWISYFGILLGLVSSIALVVGWLVSLSVIAYITWLILFCVSLVLVPIGLVAIYLNEALRLLRCRPSFTIRNQF